MENLELPKGWIETDLQSLLISLENGARPKGGVANITEGIPSFGGEHLTYNHEFNVTSMRFIPIEFANKMMQGRIYPNDILVVKDGATTGKTCFVGADFPYEKAFVNEHVFIVRTSTEHFVPKYLYYFLWSYTGQNQIKENITGTAQGGINQKIASNLKLKIPPLAEQTRIVAEIETVISWVSEAQEELAKIPALLRAFRQKVLAMAVSGELTKDFRENTEGGEMATEIVKKIKIKRFKEAETKTQKDNLKKIFDIEEEGTQHDIPNNWCFAILDKLCAGFQYGTSEKSENEGLIPVLRMGNLQNSEIDWSNLKYTSNVDEIEKYKLNKGDVLFNRTNSPEHVGKTSIYRGEQPAIFAGYLIKIKNLPELNSHYLNFCLNTPFANEWKSKVQIGAVNQANINAEKLSNFEIPFCSLIEQAEIVKRVEALFDWLETVEAAYTEGVSQLKVLPQSLLHKAFSGQLVPQDPKDEPASVLLERIQAEKKRQAEAAKKGKMTKSPLKKAKV